MLQLKLTKLQQKNGRKGGVHFDVRLLRVTTQSTVTMRSHAMLLHGCVLHRSLAATGGSSGLWNFVAVLTY